MKLGTSSDENIFGTPIATPRVTSNIPGHSTMTLLQRTHTQSHHQPYRPVSHHGPSSLSQSTPQVLSQPFAYFIPRAPPPKPYYSQVPSPYLTQHWSPVPSTQFYTSQTPPYSPSLYLSQSLQPPFNYNIQQQVNGVHKPSSSKDT